MGGLSVETFRDFHGLNLVTEVFVETGTFAGVTLKAAAEAGFPELHSIDVVADYTEHARMTNSHHPNMHLYTGTSPDILPKILDKDKHVTFWLDAHFQAYKENETCEKYGECPVLAELQVIFSVAWTRPPIILIDDAHMFDGTSKKRYKDSDWPTVEQIKAMLPEGYNMKILDDILVVTHD